MPVVADLHDFIEEQDPDQSASKGKVGSGSASKIKRWIQIKVMQTDPQRTFSDIRTTRGKKILCN
jgi:hypothetical protein